MSKYYGYNIFLTCVVFALYKRLYLYAYSFLLLCYTSYLSYIINDNNQYFSIYIMDKIAIGIIIIIGSIYYAKCYTKTIIPVVAFLTTIVIYIMLPNYINNYIIHLTTTIGHLAIIYYQ